MRLQSASGFQASRLFGLNAEAHPEEIGRIGDLGLGNRLIGKSSSSDDALDIGVSDAQRSVQRQVNLLTRFLETGVDLKLRLCLHPNVSLSPIWSGENLPLVTLDLL